MREEHLEEGWNEFENKAGIQSVGKKKKNEFAKLLK
jgi:hypothetical protein